MMRKRDALTEQDFVNVEQELQQALTPKPPKVSWLFVAFMLALALMCVVLGLWQLNRLAEKQELIARVEQRLTSSPVELPPVAEWSAFDAEVFDFLPVSVTGTYESDQTMLVFTALTETRGARSGPGYWVMTPLKLRGGGTVIINRGFIPQSTKNLFDGSVGGNPAPSGVQTVEGIARISERTNTFTPGPDFEARVDHVRSIERMSAMMDPALAPFVPIYLDAKAGVPDALPQAGETKVSFPNRHMEYVLTWFSLAAVALVMTGFWLWRQRRS